jgi:hypothetical protein
MELKLNNSTHYPNLDKGMDTDYLYERIMPRLYSMRSTGIQEVTDSSVFNYTSMDHNDDFQALRRLRERKNIFAYPFCLMPESHNPSGELNFNLVTKATLTLHLDITDAALAVGTHEKEDFQIDVWYVVHNWAQLADGAMSKVFQ